MSKKLRPTSNNKHEKRIKGIVNTILKPTYIASCLLTDNKGRDAGYTLEFKNAVVRLLSSNPTVQPTDVSDVIRASPHIVRAWQTMHAANTLKNSPRDDLYKNLGQVAVLSDETFDTTLRQSYKELGGKSRAQREYITDYLDDNRNTLLVDFREGDGDPITLPYYFREVVKHVEFQLAYADLPTDDKVTPITAPKAAPPEVVVRSSTPIAVPKSVAPGELEAIVKRTLNALRTKRSQYDIFEMQEACSVDDTLWSIRCMFPTFAAAHVAIGKCCDYSAGYIGPHLSKRLLPKQIRSAVQERMLHVPHTNKWYLCHKDIITALGVHAEDHTVVSALLAKGKYEDMFVVYNVPIVPMHEGEKSSCVSSSHVVPESMPSTYTSTLPVTATEDTPAVLSDHLPGEEDIPPMRIKLNNTPTTTSTWATPVLAPTPKNLDELILHNERQMMSDVYALSKYVHRMVAAPLPEEAISRMGDAIPTFAPDAVHVFVKMMDVLYAETKDSQ